MSNIGLVHLQLRLVDSLGHWFAPLALKFQLATCQFPDRELRDFNFTAVMNSFAVRSSFTHI